MTPIVQRGRRVCRGGPFHKDRTDTGILPFGTERPGQPGQKDQVNGGPVQRGRRVCQGGPFHKDRTHTGVLPFGTETPGQETGQESDGVSSRTEDPPPVRDGRLRIVRVNTFDQGPHYHNPRAGHEYYPSWGPVSF